MKFLDQIDWRKVLGTIIGGIIFLSCILFFTYAYYNWRSENTTVGFDIEDASLKCISGPSVNVHNIGPVLNYQDGVKAIFSVNNNKSGNATVSLSLDITSISDTLLVESFKYKLVQDVNGGNNFDYSNPIVEGNFSTFQVGTNLIKSDVTVGSNAIYSYQFIVYIDGTMYNPENMQQNSLNSILVIGNCDSSVNYLSSVAPGSYVSYTGNNGCSGSACSGQNANYVSDTNMGYCFSSDYKFNVNGWRVGYIKDGTAYLISAGAPECMCTDSNGTSSNSSCSDYETTNGVPMHLANLDSKALTYCNTNYAYGGICNSSSAWAMDSDDFQNITGSVLSSSSCFSQLNSIECGYGNNLIDNGSYYWYATPYSASSIFTFFWFPNNRFVYDNDSYIVIGVRPVLRLASSVFVVGGSGTYEDPYQISNS